MTNVQENVTIVDRFYLDGMDFKRLADPDDGHTVATVVEEMIESYMAKHTSATLDEVHDYLICRGLALGILDKYPIEYESAWPFLVSNYGYDKSSQRFFVKASY